MGNKQILLVNYDGYYDEIIDWLRVITKKGFITKDVFNCFKIVNSVEDVEKILNKYLEG